MIVGEYNTVEILRHTVHGLYLGDGSEESVLLPNKYVPENYTIGDEIEVFIYRDHEDRKIATTLKPKIGLHEFACLKVVDVNKIGAFLDWGLEKDLLVPFREQRQKMEVGRHYVVFLDIDLKTDRLYATAKLDKILDNNILNVEKGDEVDLIIIHKTELGFSAVVDQQHKGLLYSNEVFRKLVIGDRVKGYVKKIRDENKLDLSLQPIGYRQFNDANAALVFKALEQQGGFIPLNDKSNPEAINTRFGISKKAFKKAIGALYKSRRIKIVPQGIELNKEE